MNVEQSIDQNSTLLTSPVMHRRAFSEDAQEGFEENTLGKAYIFA